MSQDFLMMPIKPVGAINLHSDYVVCGGEHGLAVDSPTSTAFLHKLSKKMHDHGSIVMDTCSAAGDNSPAQNLAQFVSNMVGKGVRVSGPPELLYTTDVQRFDVFFSQFNRRQGNIYVSGGTCPEWALRT